MQPTLFEQGLILMLVGMGTVIVFLTLLVVAMTVMERCVRRFLPQPVVSDITDEEIAVITAAIARHRNEHS